MRLSLRKSEINKRNCYETLHTDCSICAAHSPSLLLASPETELCRYSEYGQDNCIQKLVAFLETTPDGPLSDEELDEIYGCLVSDDQSTTQEYEISSCTY